MATSETAFQEFCDQYPGYSETTMLDDLRERSFQRLGGSVYVDYMGGCLAPDSLVQWHASLLQSSLFGNTHSLSPSSQCSSSHAEQARKATLQFFDAPEDQYVVVFTSSATSSLKLVGEAFPFNDTSRLVLPVDAHNSAHGIRSFASKKGAEVVYLDSPSEGGLFLGEAKDILFELGQTNEESGPSLFIFSGQSNVTNSRTPLTIADYAKKHGFYTLLDAAALAPTCPISLRATPVDAMAVSFYKMFGYPTGVGALVMRKEFADFLSRSKPWFAGGTVDIVQVPGKIVTLAESVEERFEEGTINYLALPVIPQGLSLLQSIRPYLQKRLPAITLWLIDQLEAIRHPNGSPGVVVLSRRPSRTYVSSNQQDDSDNTGASEQLTTGSTVSMLMLEASGEPIALSRVNKLSSEMNISLRTGCMCNPGGAAGLLESHFRVKTFMQTLDPSATLSGLESTIGYELGVVRVSLGMVSNWNDVYAFVEFAKGIVLGDHAALERLKLRNVGQPLQKTPTLGRRASSKIVKVWKQLSANGISRRNSQRAGNGN